MPLSGAYYGVMDTGGLTVTVIYVDNASTSCPKPPAVYDGVCRCMSEYCANPGRGGHSMSIEAGRRVYEVREKICKLFGIPSPMNVCFMKNATEALNTAIYGMVKPESHVVITCMEHNSVYRPLKVLERDAGIGISVVKGNSYGEIDPDDVGRLIRPETSLVISTASSNVNGIVMPVGDIGRIAREHGKTFLVDAAQGAGYMDMDVAGQHIDLLAFPGHKALLGPQGTGGLYVREGVSIKPLMQGGTGSNSDSAYQPEHMPDLLESGTLNTPGITGLGCALDYIEAAGIPELSANKSMLVDRLGAGLNAVKGIRILSRQGIKCNTGIMAIDTGNADPVEVCRELDRKYGIATRAGLHCAPLAHEALGTLHSGALRISVGCFNTVDEMDCIVDAVEKTVRMLA